MDGFATGLFLVAALPRVGGGAIGPSPERKTSGGVGGGGAQRRY